MTFFWLLLEQWGRFIGLIYLIGFTFALLSSIAITLMSRKLIVIYPIAFLGVIVHELSHLIVGLLFNHKVEEVDFFTMNDDTSFSGFVILRYNPRNLYHRLGQYFVAVAPIMLGILLIMTAMSFLSPELFRTLTQFSTDASGQGQLISFRQLYLLYRSMFYSLRYQTLLLSFIMISVLSFIALSKKDLINSIASLVILLPLWTIVGYAMHLIQPTLWISWHELLRQISYNFVNISLFLIGFYLLWILILAIISSVIRLIIK